MKLEARGGVVPRMRALAAAALLAAIVAGALFILQPRPEASARAPDLLGRVAEGARRLAAPAASGPQSGADPETEATREVADARAEARGAQVYYQWVDETGSVHFVRSLDAVPAHWRDRAGRIEVEQKASAPPTRQTARRRATESAAARRPAAASHEVVVYTTSWCGWCRRTLAWLDQRGVDYVNKDIESDPGHRDELVRKTGRTSIPVVEIDGELIRGYDPGRMEAMLGS